MEIEKHGKYRIHLSKDDVETILLNAIDDAFENDEAGEIISIEEDGTERIVDEDSEEYEALAECTYDMTSSVEVTPNGEVNIIFEGDIEYETDEEED